MRKSAIPASIRTGAHNGRLNHLVQYSLHGCLQHDMTLSHATYIGWIDFAKPVIFLNALSRRRRYSLFRVSICLPMTHSRQSTRMVCHLSTSVYCSAAARLLPLHAISLSSRYSFDGRDWSDRCAIATEASFVQDPFLTRRYPFGMITSLFSWSAIPYRVMSRKAH